MGKIIYIDQIPVTVEYRRVKNVNLYLKPPDGQVLVLHDMLGINKGFSPRFLRRYADLYTTMTDAVSKYIEDVKSGDFPNENEQY